MLAFKVDENLPREIVALLRTAAHDAVSVRDQQLQGAEDEVLACVCRQEQRAIVTLDLGFADIRRYPPHEHAGIIVLRPQRRDRASVVAALAGAMDQCSRETLVGWLWIVTDTGIRMRSR